MNLSRPVRLIGLILVIWLIVLILSLIVVPRLPWEVPTWLLSAVAILLATISIVADLVGLFKRERPAPAGDTPVDRRGGAYEARDKAAREEAEGEAREKAAKEVAEHEAREVVPDEEAEPFIQAIPTPETIAVGRITVVEIWVEHAVGLYGADIRLGFDPRKLEVQDSDLEISGIQIEPGPFLDVRKGFVAQNSADNTWGRINYAMSLLSPARPVDGTGVVMRITFKGIAAGDSPINFVSVLLSDRYGGQIPVTASPGNVKVTE